MLAVSGGRDSMVLLRAVGALRSVGASGADGNVVVATFDHLSGGHAVRSVDHVRQAASEWSLPVVVGRSESRVHGEAAWRAARWRFLRQVAGDHAAVVATAHTRDDHVETIVMRLLRGAGARGLAALRAPSAVRRPLLGVTRRDVATYARQRDVSWIEDPSNSDRAYLRNRVRLDLLPALRAMTPGLERDLLSLAERAATLRRRCCRIVDPLIVTSGPGRVVARGVTDDTWTSDARALLWQSIAERGGVTLDRRGTSRLARFSSEGRPGGRIPLSGGFEAVHRRDTIEVRRRAVVSGARVPLGVSSDTHFGDWRFRCLPDATLDAGNVNDPWRAWLPADGMLEVRAWRDGDRLVQEGRPARRVKRFFADQRVPAFDREGWPVVVADGEIIWIPGVRRGDAATVRSGRPRVCIICERLNG